MKFVIGKAVIIVSHNYQHNFRNLFHSTCVYVASVLFCHFLHLAALIHFAGEQSRFSISGQICYGLCVWCLSWANGNFFFTNVQLAKWAYELCMIREFTIHWIEMARIRRKSICCEHWAIKKNVSNIIEGAGDTSTVNSKERQKFSMFAGNKRKTFVQVYIRLLSRYLD